MLTEEKNGTERKTKKIIAILDKKSGRGRRWKKQKIEKKNKDEKGKKSGRGKDMKEIWTDKWKEKNWRRESNRQRKGKKKKENNEKRKEEKEKKRK